MDNPNFFLEGVVKEKNEFQDFEGPLSLILHLLSKNKIEIRDISIADILDQYLEYLEKMQSMDLEIASEFVQMAAHLLYIKTRTLLSSDEEVSELEVLMSSLEQLKCRDIFASVQKVLPELKAASELGLLYHAKQPEPLPTDKEYKYNHKPVDLLQALYSMYSRGGKPVPPDMQDSIPHKLVYSIRDKSFELLQRLKECPARLDELYQSCRSKSEVVATFVSVLELCSMGSIEINRCDEGYRLRFIGGDLDEIMEKIVE